MTIRKRRQPTPDFKLPPPYEPITGRQAPLKAEGEFPYCALMQVAAEDSHADYVICRGFDTRIRRFVDYEAGNADKPGIAVAKPYGNRVMCYYKVGSVYPAFLPLGKLGQNPGVVDDIRDACLGQPEGLDVEVEFLKDENDKYINWMLIDSGPAFLWVELKHDLYPCGVIEGYVLTSDSEGNWCDTCEHTKIHVYDVFGVVSGSALAADGYIPAGCRALAMRVSHPDPTVPTCLWAAVSFGSPECCESQPSVPSQSSPSGSPSPPSSLSSLPSSPYYPSPSGESKSPAIVPASWSEDGYTALFTMESPTVDFTDTIKVAVPHRNGQVDIDPRFLEVCEKDTIVCVGIQSDRPLLIGAEAVGPVVKIRFCEQSDVKVRLVISLRGTRRGFSGIRFPNRTQEQFEANERFLKSAYPGA